MKSSRNLVDPQLLPFFDDFPDIKLSDQTLKNVREFAYAASIYVDQPPASVIRTELHIPGWKGHPEVPALLFTPAKKRINNAGYLQIHGGGMIMGAAKYSDAANIELCDTLGIVVLAVDYRLAPEHPFPAAICDCYAGLQYLHNNTKTLGLDPARIAIGGESAGGGLAASLAIFAREQSTLPICHQQLVYPMLDDTTGREPQSNHAHLGEYCWTASSNRYGWSSYLGQTDANDAYIPSRISDLSELPPTWVGVGDLDLFLPENKLYAERLINAGVTTTIEIYNGAPHGFPSFRDADVTKVFWDDYMTALVKGLGC